MKSASKEALPPFGSLLPSEAERSPGKVVRCDLSNCSAEQKRKIRAEQNRKAQQARRARLASQGDRKIEIVITANEWALLQCLAQQQRGPLEGFYRRALILGATFAANAGTPRGKKAKGNSGAAAIRGAFADMSAGAQGGAL